MAALWAIVEEDKDLACPEILELVLRLRRWMRGDRGRTAMNRTFSVWRGRSPRKIGSMLGWLARPDVAARFAAGDASWALRELNRGLIRIADGEVADKAFEH